MLTINGKDFNAPTAGQLLLAKHAYERYGATTDNLNFLGQPMPTWEELPALIQLAWVAAASPDYVAKATAIQKIKPTPEELAEAVRKINAEYELKPISRKLILDITSDLTAWLCATYSEGWIYDVFVETEAQGFQVTFKRIDAA